MGMSVTKKFIYTLVLLLLVCSGTIYFAATYNYSKTLTATLTDNIHEAQRNFNAIVTASQNEFLHVSQVASQYAGLGTAILSQDIRSIDDIAKDILKKSQVTVVTVTDAMGNVITRAHSEKKGDSIASQPSIAKALKGTSNTGLVMGVEAPFSLRASSPISQDGKVVGTISVGNSLTNPAFIDWLANFLSVQVTFFQDGKRVMTTIKDAQGKRIIGTSLNNASIETQVMKEGKTFFGSSTILGIEYFASYWPAITSDNQNMGMWFIGLPVSDMLKLEDAAQRNTIITASFICIAMIILATLIGYRFAKPIKTIAQHAALVTEGKADADLSIDSKDEFGVLAESLNKMVLKLRQQTDWYEAILNCIPSPLAAMDVNKNFVFVNSGVCNMLGKKPEELVGLPCYNWGASICRTENCAIDSCERGIDSINFEQPGMGHFRAMAARLYDSQGNHTGYVDMVFDRNQEVSLINEAEQALVNGRHDAANQLENIVSNIVAASEQLTAQISTSANGAEVASMRIIETATAMDEMNSTVLEVAKNSNISADIAENTKHQALDGAQVMKDTESTMVRLREDSVKIRTSMNELSEHAQSINAVMSVISDIADQTNLLALNAAIEAARAGEAGRGFAVVADEVRKLAEKTMTSTADVSNAIVAIQQSTDVNVQQIDATVKSIEEAAELAITSGAALNDILGLAEESADGIRTIATASEEQSATSDEIAQSIASISEIVNETKNAMQESTEAVHILSEQTQQLSNLIDELKK